MRDYYEDLWTRLPVTLRPPHIELRASFLLGHVTAGQRILDLGCGDGAFSELISEHAEVALTAADVAEAALSRARRRRIPESARFVLVPFDGELPFEDGSFELIWASEVIEHVADTARWLSEVRRVLAVGGTLLLSTPNHSRVRLAWGGVSTHSPPLGDHLHLYDARALRTLLEEFSFGPVEVRATARWPGLLASLLLARAQR